MKEWKGKAGPSYTGKRDDHERGVKTTELFSNTDTKWSTEGRKCVRTL